jgi:hypothetical protein
VTTETTDIVELRAAFEAHLRGWVYDTGCLYHLWHCIFNPNVHGHHVEPTDPTDPAGAIQWLDLLKFGIYPNQAGGWSVTNGKMLSAARLWEGPDFIAAVTAAVDAAAKEWSECRDS